MCLPACLRRCLLRILPVPAPNISAASDIANAARRAAKPNHPGRLRRWDEFAPRTKSSAAPPVRAKFARANGGQRSRSTRRRNGALVRSVEIASCWVAPDAVGVMLVGLNVQVASAGRPVPQVTVISVEKPNRPITGMVKLAVAPAFIVATGGDDGTVCVILNVEHFGVAGAAAWGRDL